MTEILNKISSIIEEYNSGAYLTKERLLVMSRELSTNIYFLTKHNIEAFNDWNAIIYNDEGSVNKATVKADFEVPELRQTRKLLEACKGVSIAINNELKIINND